MARSNLTTRFLVGTVNKFQKQYRENNEECKKANIARYITVGVIGRKGIPDIEDVLLLIKLGNNNCDDTQAEAILERWLEDEENKKRGITGAFCECCKDYCLDVAVDSKHREDCEQLEDYINQRLEMKKQLSDITNQMKKMLETVKETNNDNKTEADTGTEVESTQE